MQNHEAPPALLSRRVVLVTGAGDGIGRAAALAFADHGATVALLDRRRAPLEQVYDDIEKRGPQPVIIECDLAQAGPDDYVAIAQMLAEELGSLDGLLHNAAELGVLAPIEHYDAATWNRVIQVNLTGPFLLTRACLPLLKQSEDASIVFTTADVARHGRAYWGAYAAAGFALEGLAQTLADELATNTRVRVNTIDPGAVRTKLRARAYPAEDAHMHPLPEEIMDTYLYLLGPESRGVSGRAFTAARRTNRKA